MSPLIRLQPPTRPGLGGPPSAPDTFPKESGGEVLGARVGLLLPSPKLKARSCPGYTLTTPSPTGRIEGAAPQTHTKPVRGATPTRALGITFSWGLRLQVHPGLG